MLLTIVLFSFLCSCQRSEIGKYVYVDMSGIIHVDGKCSVLNNHKNVKADRIGVSLIDIGLQSQFCIQCVSDESYDQLISPSKDRRMVATKKLRDLYEALKSDNFDVPDSYDSFELTLTIAGEDGYSNRRIIYNTLKEYDLVSSRTFEQFSSRLFIPADVVTSKGKTILE